MARRAAHAREAVGQHAAPQVFCELAAGQHIVIVVDSAFPGDDGNYQLTTAPQ